MKILRWVPGAIVSPNPITLPAGAPDIDAVVAAEITRVPTGMCNLADHPQADIVGSLADHAVHAHDLITQGVAGPPAQAIGLDAALTALEDAAAAAPHTVPGAGATGVQNIAAAQDHAAGAAAVPHGAGADPVVAATPTRLTTRTFSLDVNTLVGDLLTLTYLEVGERVLVS